MVYVLEPQSLFVPELLQIVERAGGFVLHAAEFLDVDELAQSGADYALLDLDYTPYGILDGLAYVRTGAPGVRVVLLTGEHEPGWTARCRAAGAFSVISKAATEDELVDVLRHTFLGEPYSDPRADAA